MIENEGDSIEVIAREEMEQLHPTEQAMTRDIPAKVRTKRGDAWMRRNRETTRDQSAQATGVALP